jgi:3-methyladenine DNA glycosylase AlkC
VARGPDGAGQAQGFSLKDQLFNADTIGDLAAEYAVLPGFDPARFQAKAVAGLEPRGLLERLAWLADCAEAQLPSHFPDMADALEAAMPPALDPDRTDDDFGRFIHAVPGILAVRHGLEDHRDRALDLLEAATQRFSMEFYIRPFINRWPEETLARLDAWALHENYHVRRLVSEGTRPRLPWAGNIDIDPLVPLRFLDVLHADPTRYVTRSVANHMNDLTRHAPDVVVTHLGDWARAGRQDAKELDWMTRHALRTAVKRGEPAALALLGYAQDRQISVDLSLSPKPVAIGETLDVSVTLTATEDLPVLIDYRIVFYRPNGRAGEKVFKLKATHLRADRPQTVSKKHRLKAGASTFTLHPGPHRVIVQVNGQDRAEAVAEFVE